jgi:hypothetical protein
MNKLGLIGILGCSIFGKGCVGVASDDGFFFTDLTPMLSEFDTSRVIKEGLVLCNYFGGDRDNNGPEPDEFVGMKNVFSEGEQIQAFYMTGTNYGPIVFNVRDEDGMGVDNKFHNNIQRNMFGVYNTLTDRPYKKGNYIVDVKNGNGGILASSRFSVR